MLPALLPESVRTLGTCWAWTILVVNKKPGHFCQSTHKVSVCMNVSLSNGKHKCRVLFRVGPVPFQPWGNAGAILIWGLGGEKPAGEGHFACAVSAFRPNACAGPGRPSLSRARAAWRPLFDAGSRASIRSTTPPPRGPNRNWIRETASRFPSDQGSLIVCNGHLFQFHLGGSVL